METQAAQVRAALQGLCQRIEPSGALRRGDSTSSSIDFICLTNDPDAVARRCLRHSFQAKRNEQLLSLSLQNGLGLNLWFARMPSGDLFEPTPGNFEVLQVIHTPTRQYLRDFALHVQRAGFSLNRNEGLVTPDNRRVAWTEAGIYAALNLELPSPLCQLEFRPQNARPGRVDCPAPASTANSLALQCAGGRGSNPGPAIS